MIIMTSNLGSHEIQSAFETNEAFETAERVAKQKVMELLKIQVRPEFLNRIDDIVPFFAFDPKRNRTDCPFATRTHPKATQQTGNQALQRQRKR